MELDADGRRCGCPARDKVYFPEKGCTKDVDEYFLSVGAGITRALRDRPTTLQRFVDGVDGDFFYEKRAPEEPLPTRSTAANHLPQRRAGRRDLPHRTRRRPVGGQPRHAHLPPLLVRSADTDHPDELRIDLDPQPGTDYADAVSADHELRAVLDDHGLRGWPKTSGGRGIHVFVPIEPLRRSPRSAAPPSRPDANWNAGCRTG